jgi:hypothetical protein
MTLGFGDSFGEKPDVFLSAFDIVKRSFDSTVHALKTIAVQSLIAVPDSSPVEIFPV